MKAGREAKYEYTTFEPTDEPRDRETTSDAPRRKHTTDDPPRERKTTSEEPRTTERKTTRQPSTEDPRSKTTTSTVPIDDRTTTEETSSKSVIPEDVSHAMRWLVGKISFHSSLFLTFQHKQLKKYMSRFEKYFAIIIRAVT